MKYVVVGNIGCIYCDMAKELIKESNSTFTYFGIDTDPWVKDLFKKCGIKTVPQIWTEEGEYIGGYSELKDYIPDATRPS